MCAHEKRCAVARSRKCILCTPLAFSELRLTGRENATNLKDNSGWRSDVTDLIENNFLKYPTQVPLT